MSAPKSKLSYEAFLQVFEEGRKDSYQKPEADVLYPQLDYEHLSPEAAEAKLRANVAEQQDVLRSAFQAFDPQYTGRINVPDFRRILDNFCFKMSEKQFKSFLATQSVHSDNSLDYPIFLDSFKESIIQGDPQKWMDTIQRQLRASSPNHLSPDEVQQALKEQVTAKFAAISRAFSDIDYAKIGVVSRDDFREVLSRLTFRLNDDQFESLWSSLKVNEFNNLDYKEFMKTYCTERRPATSGGLLANSSRRPVTGDSMLGRDLRSSMSRGSMRAARPFTPLVNAEDAELKLKEKIYRHWKDIQRQCRMADPKDSGQIDQNDFTGILGRYQLRLSEEDIRKLLLKYDLRNNDSFCYPEFLRHFVLDMRLQDPSPDTSRLLGRKKELNRLQVHERGLPEGPDATAVSRLRGCVATNWKDMRREFRAIDQSSAGIVSSLDFRQVLRNFNLNLSEEEFSNTVLQYESGGAVSYNDFIRAMLRTV